MKSMRLAACLCVFASGSEAECARWCVSIVDDSNDVAEVEEES